MTPTTPSAGPIRARLLRDLVLLVLVTVGLMVGVNALLIGELKQDLAESRIDGAADLVRDEVTSQLVPIPQQLLILRDGLASAGVGPTDTDALIKRFIPILAHMPQAASIVDAAEDGSELFLRRDGDGWLGRIRAPGDLNQFQTLRISPEGQILAQEPLALTYDPRERPWYLEALDNSGTPAWTPPYIFESLRVPGMSATISWEQNGTIRVTAIDVTLARILDAIDGLHLGDNGRGFLFSGNGGVYAPPDEPTTPGDHTSTHFFSALTRLGGPLLIDAVDAWHSAGRAQQGVVRFSSGKRNWWGGFRPLTKDPDAAWVGVILPLSVADGVLGTRWQLVALTALLILALGVGLALLLVRKYSRRLRDMPKLSISPHNAEQDLRELIASGEGSHLEFKSTMRMNLHTKTPGKEIELSWLKGVCAFLNTDGGILLMGVSDNGSVLGLAADKFENDDKIKLHFKNLLNQHLGPEYARYVRFDLYMLDGEQIGAVECERARNPVFLRFDGKGQKGESFLIRNGPSNIELSVSRALKYILSRR